MVSNKEHNSAPAVSIILPTYNRAHFLCEAFESIRSQQFRDWELIIVDDGSTDDTAELVASQARDLAQPVRYVVQPNHGPYGARNTGLDVARGRYLAFFDSDDLWLPHHLAHCVEVLDANTDVDWVFGATDVASRGHSCNCAPDRLRRRG
jgi:glycosyltransferase involved in cell wall biosynthesis